MIYESEEGLIEETLPRKAKYLLAAVVTFAVLAVCFLIYNFFTGPFAFRAPVDSRLHGALVEVAPGESAASLGKDLKTKGVIGSATLFNLYTAILGDTKKIQAGLYLFKRPTGIIQAENRFIKGDFGLEIGKVTFPEGFTARQVAERLEANLPLFDKEKFWSIASGSEGYLFPETYFFTPGDSEREIYTAMILMFRKKTASLWPSDISASAKEDMVKMASVLEREVKSPEDMKIVSGIFWKRIKAGIALQADATIAYERGKASAELSTEDLKKDSPFNTYTRRDLPPTPISNPGLNAIEAALVPEESPYLYFLTDEDGKVYYAKTFEEHKKNKEKYL